MLFSEILKNVTGPRVVNGGDAVITGIAYDSRKVEPGFLFVAMQGGSFDGHDYIAKALEMGAAAIIAEKTMESVPVKVPYITIDHGRRAMGEAASAFFGFPTRKMKLVGVTGTSGKTTVTHLIQGVFNAAGMKSGLIGTVGAKIGSEMLDTKHTTPESVDLQRMLAYMVEQGVEVVAMEVSSHGLYQGRAIGCEFDCGVFTNIARDHLDFHMTLEAYLDAKLMLFREYPKMSAKQFCAVINADDEAAQKVQETAPGCIITFGIINDADLKAGDIVVTDRSVSFTMSYMGESEPVSIGIGGAFNVYNGLSAAGAALALGLDLQTIADGLRQATGAPGRFESVECGQDFGVVVDYAHTPDELENVLKTARELTSGRLITVFGCGGDRDRGKRPIMGGIGADIADFAVITSDNPRSENPDLIIQEILTGVSADKMQKIDVQRDRRAAIEKAIKMAKPGDLVVIAGKGHEDYQILADRTIHFDDREVAREVLEAV